MTYCKDKKLTLPEIIGKIRRELPPAGKPFVDKKRQSKLDVTCRKVKHKKKDIGA
jgi:hypothetical protein